MNYSFEVIILNHSVVTDKMADRLYARCNDALLHSSGGVAGMDFDREAISLEAAVVSAIADIRAAGYIARFKRVLE